jgi:hypothetical protein
MRLLVYLPVAGARAGTQPQSDMLRLHCLPDNPDKVVAEGGQVCFAAQLGREGL